MKGLNKKRLVLISIFLSVGVGWYKLKHRWREPELIYKVPDLAPMSQEAIEQSKYDEYEAILENKQNSPNKPKKSLVRFGLAKLFKPQARAMQDKSPVAQTPSKPNSNQPKEKPQKTIYFFAYQGEEKADTATATAQQSYFFKARVYKEQKVQDKGGVIVKLQEKMELADKTLPAGALLYGKAKFGKDRMYVSFTVAKWQERHTPIDLEGYDQDLLLGWSAPGLVPSLGDYAEERILQKSIKHRGSGLLEGLGKEAAETWQQVRKKKEALLEDRKGVYVRTAGKKKG